MVVGHHLGAAIFVQPSEVEPSRLYIPAIFGRVDREFAALVLICPGALCLLDLARAISGSRHLRVAARNALRPCRISGPGRCSGARTGIVGRDIERLRRADTVAVFVPLSDGVPARGAVAAILVIIVINCARRAAVSGVTDSAPCGRRRRDCRDPAAVLILRSSGAPDSRRELYPLTGLYCALSAGLYVIRWMHHRLPMRPLNYTPLRRPSSSCRSLAVRLSSPSCYKSY